MATRTARRSLPGRWSLLAMLSLVVGCGQTTRQKVELKPEALGNDQADVWTHGHRLLWASVVVGPDSVTGTDPNSVFHPGRRHGLPLTDVDSIVRIHVELKAGDYVAAGAVVALGLYGLVQLCEKDPESCRH